MCLVSQGRGIGLGKLPSRKKKPEKLQNIYFFIFQSTVGCGLQECVTQFTYYIYIYIYMMELSYVLMSR